MVVRNGLFEKPMKVGGKEEIDTKPQAETRDPRFMGSQLRTSMGEALEKVNEYVSKGKKEEATDKEKEEVPEFIEKKIHSA